MGRPLPGRTFALVIGGGPAGGFTALELAQQGCDVVLLESQSKPGWKIGETLAPEARIHLQRLRIWNDFVAQGHLPCHGIVSVWGSETPLAKDFIFNPHGHGWQLDRSRFESALLRAAAAAGWEIYFNTSLTNLVRHNGQWCADTTAGMIQAEWIFDGTGRRAAVAAQFAGAYKQYDDLVSVFVLAESPLATDADSRTYVEALPHGWCYTALIPNGQRVVTFQTDRSLMCGAPTAEWFWGQLSLESPIRKLLIQHEYQFVGTPQIAAAHTGRFEQCSGPGWIAVGDAAMTFDPLSGQGTAKTLESACQAVRAILHADDYQTRCDQMWNAYLAEYKRIYAMEKRWAALPFWSQRQQL